MGDWTFLSNYGHVLVCLARNRDARLRDVAEEVGLTERAVQTIVRDLQDAGYLAVTKQGRCNRYRINRRKTLRHSLESHCTVGKLLALVARSAQSDARAFEELPEEAERPAAEGPTAPAEDNGKPDRENGKPEPPLARQQGTLF